MKKFFSFMALVAIISASNCTRIPENNDPVLGVWSKTQIASTADKQTMVQKEEWIFNDAYLGRYHQYSNETIIFQTDFKWSSSDGIYAISYGEEQLQDIEVIMNMSGEPEQLEFEDGNILAQRE